MSSFNNTETIIIRSAIETDCQDVFGLIKELAIYEGMLDQVKIKTEDLVRDAFQTSPPLVYVLVAELSLEEKESTGSEKSKSKAIIGYALYYKTYSTWKGKAIHLEDLFVRPEYRFKGVGEKLIKHLGMVARDGNYARISFECIDWNELAMKFYKKHGAEDVTISEHWHSYRFGSEAIKELASKD